MITALVLGGTSSNVVAMITLAILFFGGLWLCVAFIGWIKNAPWKGSWKMKKAIAELKSILDQAGREFETMSESESAARSAEGKWSKKQILGHLIDSASNNHQRFVRVQLSAELKLPGYEQQLWVNTQQYQNESWENLVLLWKSYNLHLMHLISSIPETALRNYCFIGDNEPVTLEFLIEDYVKHLKHHVEQILE